MRYAASTPTPRSRFGRRHYVDPGCLEFGDDAVPARGVDERAVDQYDGWRRVGVNAVRRAHEDLLSDARHRKFPVGQAALHFVVL